MLNLQKSRRGKQVRTICNVFITTELSVISLLSGKKIKFNPRPFLDKNKQEQKEKKGLVDFHLEMAKEIDSLIENNVQDMLNEFDSDIASPEKQKSTLGEIVEIRKPFKRRPEMPQFKIEEQSKINSDNLGFEDDLFEVEQPQTIDFSSKFTTDFENSNKIRHIEKIENEPIKEEEFFSKMSGGQDKDAQELLMSFPRIKVKSKDERGKDKTATYKSTEKAGSSQKLKNSSYSANDVSKTKKDLEKTKMEIEERKKELERVEKEAKEKEKELKRKEKEKEKRLKEEEKLRKLELKKAEIEKREIEKEKLIKQKEKEFKKRKIELEKKKILEAKEALKEEKLTQIELEKKKKEELRIEKEKERLKELELKKAEIDSKEKEKLIKIDQQKAEIETREKEKEMAVQAKIEEKKEIELERKKILEAKQALKEEKLTQIELEAKEAIKEKGLKEEHEKSKKKFGFKIMVKKDKKKDEEIKTPPAGMHHFIHGKKVAEEENPLLDKDIKKVLTIIDDLFEKLPDEVIEEFANSKNFELYEKVVSKYKKK